MKPSTQKLRLLDIKHAIIHDGRFRELFPELSKEFTDVLNNPGCGCNIPIFHKVLKYKERLRQYFPNREIEAPEEEIKELSQNRWQVINCKANELEEKLNKLYRTGRKQIAVARWQDEITIVVNDLGLVF